MPARMQKITTTIHAMNGRKNRKPNEHTAMIHVMIVMTPQVIWKFNASTAWDRTVADSLPLTSSATRGAMKPTTIPPKWEMSAHVFSSLLA
jgi:hypothetical protein